MWAGEGKWTPQQVLKLNPAELKKQGLQLPVRRLWDPVRGTGLLAATVNTGGCSAGFVSEAGLVLTNHHCLFGMVQEHSRPGRDLITNGFLAGSRDEELPSKTGRVNVPRKFTDVTAQMEAAVPAGASDLERAKALEAKEKALVAECEMTPAARCRVAAFDGGVQYVLVESMEILDVRLVYAPPRMIGEYGGEGDNWMWPRHTGDFSMARAYVGRDGKPAPYSKDNVPYKPEFFFPISTEGVKPGDFVMVLGYPGTTVRSLTALEMADREKNLYERRVDLYGAWIRLIEEATKGDEAGIIATAATLKSLNNVYKNAGGQIAGLKRGRIIAKQKAAEAEVEKWAAGKPEWQSALAAKKRLDEMVAEKERTAARAFLLQTVASGGSALRQALQLVKLAGERGKPDAEREPAYMNRMMPMMVAGLERAEKSYFRRADEALAAEWIGRALKLGAGERIKSVDAAFGQGDVKAKLAGMYDGTKVTSLAERLKMFEETPEQLKARRDPMIDFAIALQAELDVFNEQAKAIDGAVAKLRPAWRKAVIAHAGKPVAPDANSTLRVSFAHVKGYAPRDGVVYTPQTTLAGMMEKHTGEDPFDVPKKVREAYEAGKAGRWKDARLGEVPLCFLADADTTGGNSGSPTVNGRGELVGLNFDRVWENVANDFGYNPEIARNVNVDIRFFLWMLDEVENADGLLKELKIRK
ncbi:MAG: S46 family peptidase [Bryobacteraceae bacterium]|nr:S46 family peptidase [Bryobacteraceae bacterium]